MKKISKKIAKIITPLTICAGCSALIPATSCGTPMYHDIHHIAPYLHEITYDDYRYDSEYETTKEAEAFGCSSVRKGNFYGRNFDYVYNDTPEFVVHMKANEEKHRFASLGVATHFGLREGKVNVNAYDKQLELVPNLTLDGINENGVICSTNVVSMEAKLPDSDFIPETHPNDPNYQDLHMLFIPRFVLDNATSVDDAVNKLNARNIMGNLNDELFLHVMIADKNETRIIEFVPTTKTDKHFSLEQKVCNETDKLPIMTNHYLNHNSKVFTNDKRFGLERYEILKTYRSFANSFEDMQALLKKVKFSQAYEYGHNAVPYNAQSSDVPPISGDLNSEWYSETVSQSEMPDDNKSYAEWKAFADATYTELKKAYWDIREKELRSTDNHPYWQTTHNSTYDITTGRLEIIVQEEYTKIYRFKLDLKNTL